MLLKCAHCEDDTTGQWPARLVFDLAAAEAGLGGPEQMETVPEKPEAPAPTPEITLAAVKAETDELRKTIEGSDLPGNVKGEFKTDVDALLKELEAMGEGATAELLADAHGQLVAIQTDLDGVLNPYLLQVVQGASPDAPGVPEGTTVEAPGLEGIAPPGGEAAPVEAPPVPDESATAPATPEAPTTTNGALRNPSLSFAPPERSDGTPGLNEANTLVSIEKSLDQPPGAVEFTYYSEEGELQFHMANGRVQVTYPDGQMATYSIYRRVDNSPTHDGPMLPPSTPATFYVASQPRGPQGYFAKNAAEQGTWYHGFERNKATSGAIGMTPESILQMATQIATGKVAPGQDGQLPTSEKRITPDRERMQRGEDHLTIQQVSDGPAGYQLSQEISRGDGTPPLRLYTSPTNAGAVLIRVGHEQAEIKSVRDTAAGMRVIRYQLPGQPVQTVQVEAPTESVSGKMKGYLKQHADRSDSESPLVAPDARVVQVGPSVFYQDGEGPWRVVTQDGQRASLYSEADPLAMNQLENQLTALGAKYEERKDFRIGVGGVLFVPDAATATPTEVTYRGALPDGRLLVLTVSGAPTVEGMPYTLAEVDASGRMLKEKHHYGSKASLEAEFNAFLETKAAPRPAPVDVATA